MAGLSKSRILMHLQCPKRLWLAVHRPELAQEDDTVNIRLAAGHAVGEIARRLHPEGILIDTLEAKEALARTASLLARKRRPIVFEAAFALGEVLVRPDLLLPVRGGYRLVEVKSATKVKEYHLADAAIQSFVARKTGLPVKRVEIAHIDKNFVYPGKERYQGLLDHVDVTKEVTSLEKDVPGWRRAALETLACPEPTITPGDRCSTPFPCPFADYCVPDTDEDGYPPEILPNAKGKAMAAALRSKGCHDLRKAPKAMIEGPMYQRIWRVTKSGKPELDPEVSDKLQSLPYPRYYLDFETIDFAVPIWTGTRPYRQIPFQWSCHVERKNGAIGHQAFLSTGQSDPRRDFAESLLKALAARGSVFVYNAPFEAARLKELAEEFPDLAQGLDAIRRRIIDLLPLARKHYYHRDMFGSWSLKRVLPTIAPELAYDDLDVADGGMAQEAFLEMIHPETKPARKKKLREALLAYCQRDTLGLVALARFFSGNNLREIL